MGDYLTKWHWRVIISQGASKGDYLYEGGLSTYNQCIEYS
jgi:hypothetical protein